MNAFFLKSRATRGPRRAFFARWSGERESPIAKKVFEVLFSLKSSAQRGIPIPARGLEVHR
jgi:hypothetical protein